MPASDAVLAGDADYQHERAEILGEGDDCDYVFVNLYREPLGAPVTYRAAKRLFERLVTPSAPTTRKTQVPSRSPHPARERLLPLNVVVPIPGGHWAIWNWPGTLSTVLAGAGCAVAGMWLARGITTADARLREGLARLLADRGHEVPAAVADAEALRAAVAEHAPDVVIADIRMRAGAGCQRRHRPRPRGDQPVAAQARPRPCVADLAGARGARAHGRGRSNSGIAGKLVLSESVVEKHIASIFGKLALGLEAADNRRVLAVLRYLRA